MRSSRDQEGRAYQGEEEEEEEVGAEPPAPKEERPRARRKMWSMCARAAVVVGEEEVGIVSEEREVEELGKGAGMYVTTNMWYV